MDVPLVARYAFRPRFRRYNLGLKTIPFQPSSIEYPAMIDDLVTQIIRAPRAVT